MKLKTKVLKVCHICDQYYEFIDKSFSLSRPTCQSCLSHKVSFETKDKQIKQWIEKTKAEVIKELMI